MRSELQTIGETPVGDYTVDVYDATLNTWAYIDSRRTYRYSGKDAKAASAQAKRDYRRETGCKNRLRANWFVGLRAEASA